MTAVKTQIILKSVLKMNTTVEVNVLVVIIIKKKLCHRSGDKILVETLGELVKTRLW